MGTSFAPAYAAIYLHVLEWEAWMEFANQVKYKRHYYVRYIYDVFAVLPCKTSATLYVSLCNSRRSPIKLFASYGDSAIVLALVMNKGQQFLETNALDTKIYQKEMNNYQDIPQDSYHSKPISKAL
jgi:hypothetical protein